MQAHNLHAHACWFARSGALYLSVPGCGPLAGCRDHETDGHDLLWLPFVFW